MLSEVRDFKLMDLKICVREQRTERDWFDKQDKNESELIAIFEQKKLKMFWIVSYFDY